MAAGGRTRSTPGGLMGPKEFEIVGVHSVEPSQRLMDETVEIQFGAGLSGRALDEARENVRQHFAGLFLLEVRIDPPGEEIDWLTVTQPIPDTPRSNWQVPYDERCISASDGRWAFFFHYLQADQPIQTPAGPRSLPQPTPCPAHLADLTYEAP